MISTQSDNGTPFVHIFDQKLKVRIVSKSIHLEKQTNQCHRLNQSFVEVKQITDIPINHGPLKKIPKSV